MASYHQEPQQVDRVDTQYRRIQTDLPVPESIPILERSEQYEPRSMLGQPPIVWDKAEGFQVYDRWGNVWLDWSSGVLVMNAGHAHPAIREAIQEQVDKPLLATYVFMHEKRAELAELLVSIAPEKLTRVFLLSTGSEATENTIKLARTYGIRQGGREKHVIVGFDNGFHGRTLGAQLAGGMQSQKDWIVNLDPGFVSVPFPDGFHCEDRSFDLFLSTLEEKGVEPKNIAGIIFEPFQGVGPFFMPVEYAQQLEAFCRENDILIICDEVQSGFGRSGKWFTFEHYGITPDLIACGKGISSSLPISAVIGREDVMNLYKPGSMTSTHSASPLPVASAVANIRAMQEENIVQHAAEMEAVLAPPLFDIQKKYPESIGSVNVKGLVAGMQVVKPGTKQADPDRALAINEKCFQMGLLMFAPVGTGGQCIKIAPPLITPEDALEEGAQVLAEACDAILS